MASILKELLKKYPQKVKLIWKDAPNPNSSQALLAAEAAKCAQEQGKFWEYHDLLFANQNYLSPSLYLEMARQLNLDTSRFETCLQSKKWNSIIQASLAEAQALGINGTPYLFIGDKRRISGQVSLAELEKIIQEIK
jgi:protein-disulfide isomerase